MSKITRWVKVGFDDDQYAQLLLQAEDDCRDKSELLKALWVRFTRSKVRGDSGLREPDLRPFAAPAGPVEHLASGFADTVGGGLDS